MNIQNFLFVACVIFGFVLSGCSSEETNNKANEIHKIVVEKHKDNDKYKVHKKITDSGQLIEIEEILNRTDWQNVLVSMAYPEDYRLNVEYENNEMQDKPLEYKVWIRSNKEQAEILVINSKYGQLNKIDTGILFELISKKDND